MTKPRDIPRWPISRRSSRTQTEWKVESHTARASVPRTFSTRSRISPAALFVKVTARIPSGAMPQTPTR
jgi:hypothetical protein